MLTTELVNPATLTGFVRELQFPNVNALERYLPAQQRLAIEYAFDRTDKKRRKMAQFRPFDVESPVGERPGVARVRGRIPPISKKMVLGEEETLLVDALRRQQTLTPEMEREIYDDAYMLTSDIADRVEFARGQVLTTGKVTFTNDLGFETAEIDFGIPGGNFVTTPGAAWSDTVNAVPITDMRGWMLTYQAANANRLPVVGLTSTTVLTNLMLNAQMKSFLATPVVGGTLPILTLDQAQAVLRTQGLPPLIAVDEMVNVNGTDTRVIPEGRVVFVPAPSPEFGETTYGPTVEALNLAKAGYLSAETAPGLTAVNMVTFDPQHTWTKVSGLVVPVLKDPNAVMVADVSV
jgi:hypothetical protein